MSAPITALSPLQILQGQLLDAQQARHNLMIGKQVVSLADGEGDSATFSQVDLYKLDAYIADLQARIGAMTGNPVRRGPLLAVF